MLRIQLDIGLRKLLMDPKNKKIYQWDIHDKFSSCALTCNYLVKLYDQVLRWHSILISKHGMIFFLKIVKQYLVSCKIQLFEIESLGLGCLSHWRLVLAICTWAPFIRMLISCEGSNDKNVLDNKSSTWETNANQRGFEQVEWKWNNAHTIDRCLVQHLMCQKVKSTMRINMVWINFGPICRWMHNINNQHPYLYQRSYPWLMNL